MTLLSSLVLLPHRVTRALLDLVEPQSWMASDATVDVLPYVIFGWVTAIIFE
jgi:hypothetical protein